jgi:hypothetical protein
MLLTELNVEGVETLILLNSAIQSLARAVSEQILGQSRLC